MSIQEVEELTEAKMKKLRNLRMFRIPAKETGRPIDDIIREFYLNRIPKELKPKEIKIPAEVLNSGSDDEEYDKNFKTKLKALQNEYGLDMNNSNDAEALRSLVRHIIQQENVNIQIVKLQQEEELDTRTLKNLGDYQRTLVTSITDMQEKLGIARKLRKEKQVDDIAVFIEALKVKSKDFFDRKTVQVRCEKCEIELARYWLNFPKLTENVFFEMTCWKCSEKVIYSL